MAVHKDDELDQQIVEDMLAGKENAFRQVLDHHILHELANHDNCVGMTRGFEQVDPHIEIRWPKGARGMSLDALPGID